MDLNFVTLDSKLHFHVKGLSLVLYSGAVDLKFLCFRLSQNADGEDSFARWGIRQLTTAQQLLHVLRARERRGQLKKGNCQDLICLLKTTWLSQEGPTRFQNVRPQS